MNQPDTETFFYFAYGSNLLSRRLPERTPSARKLSVGVLKQHELRSHLAATDGSRFPVQASAVLCVHLSPRLKCMA